MIKKVAPENNNAPLPKKKRPKQREQKPLFNFGPQPQQQHQHQMQQPNSFQNLPNPPPGDPRIFRFSVHQKGYEDYQMQTLMDPNKFPPIPPHYNEYIQQFTPNIKTTTLENFEFSGPVYRRLYAGVQEIVKGVVQEGLRIDKPDGLGWGRVGTYDGYLYYGLFLGGNWGTDRFLGGFRKGVKIYPGAYKAEVGVFENLRLVSGRVVSTASANAARRQGFGGGLGGGGQPPQQQGQQPKKCFC